MPKRPFFGLFTDTLDFCDFSHIFLLYTRMFCNRIISTTLPTCIGRAVDYVRQAFCLPLGQRGTLPYVLFAVGARWYTPPYVFAVGQAYRIALRFSADTGNVSRYITFCLPFGQCGTPPYVFAVVQAYNRIGLPCVFCRHEKRFTLHYALFAVRQGFVCRVFSCESRRTSCPIRRRSCRRRRRSS